MPRVTEGKSQPEWDLDCPRKELTPAPLPSLPLPRLADRLAGFFWPQTRAGHFTVFSLVKYSTSSQVNVTVPIPQMEKWRLRKQAVSTQTQTHVCDAPPSGPAASLGHVEPSWGLSLLRARNQLSDPACPCRPAHQDPAPHPGSQLCCCPPLTTPRDSRSGFQPCLRSREAPALTAQAAKSRGCVATGQCSGLRPLHDSTPGQKGACPGAVPSGWWERGQPGRIQQNCCSG